MPLSGPAPEAPALREVDHRISEFKTSIAAENVETIVQRHITFGSCHVLSDGQYFKLKQVVSREFNVHPSEVLVVGSAKLGFSIASGKRFRPFCDTSDIDVAVISSSAFDSIWQSVFEFKCAKGYWDKERSFNEYLARGWIRPDMLPPAKKFRQCKQWWEFFQGLSRSREFGPIKITAGLYRNWRFLEAYQSVAVEECIAEEFIK
jgi:hypothetical protein